MLTRRLENGPLNKVSKYHQSLGPVVFYILLATSQQYGNQGTRNRVLFLLYRKSLKSSKMVYNGYEMKNGMTKERRMDTSP